MNIGVISLNLQVMLVDVPGYRATRFDPMVIGNIAVRVNKAVTCGKFERRRNHAITSLRIIALATFGDIAGGAISLGPEILGLGK